MTDMIDMIDLAKNVAKHLEISISTLKKYTGLIEQHSSYTFKRGNRGQIFYGKDDVQMLERFIILKNQSNTTLDEACITLVNELNLNTAVSTQTKAEVDYTPNMNHELIAMLQNQQKQLEQQQQQIKYLTSLLENQKAIGHMETNNSNKQMASVLREMQEIRNVVVGKRTRRWYQFWK